MNQIKAIKKALTAIKHREPAHIQFARTSKLVINRLTPLVMVYRIPRRGKDQLLSALVQSEACFLIGREEDVDFQRVLAPLVRRLIDEYGACLLIEVWQDRALESEVSVHISRKIALATADKLIKSLQDDDAKLSLTITLKKEMRRSGPPGSTVLFEPLAEDLQRLTYVGLAIKPTYIDQQSGSIYPLVLRNYRDLFVKSLHKAFMEFVRLQTTAKVSQFRLLGTTELQPLVWEIDRNLAAESQKFDFLLLVSPVNEHEAWLQFKKDKFLKTPKFRYRPMPIDPELVKRNLYNQRIEDLTDPTMAYLFRDKRKELDAMMTMLIDRGNEGFLLGSQQLFGHVSDRLLDTAKALMLVYEDPPGTRSVNRQELMDADEFAKLAEDELAYLRTQYPDLVSSVRIRDDISGVMVNRGVLNISKRYQIERNRAMALIQHEVGTHVVTYFNGKAQPFKLFSLGVPGYEELQEGMAVFSEYLVGGLTRERLRILAARVLAVQHMLGGASFSDTFFLLIDQYGFAEKTAFNITVRVYRSGGLTKDAIYLRGLLALLEYIRQGNELFPLLIGKIRADYIPIVTELTQRKLLREPVLRPRYLSEAYAENIRRITQGGGTIFNL